MPVYMIQAGENGPVKIGHARVIAVERATGISRHELRPDLYPPLEPAEAA